MQLLSTSSGPSQLSIFENFRTDYSLPKHAKKNDSGVSQTTGSFGVTVGGSSDSLGGTVPSFFVDAGGVGNTSSVIQYKKEKKPIWHKIIPNALLCKLRVTKKPTIEWEMPVEEFFKSLKNSKNELKSVGEKETLYINAIKRAASFGQEALKEKLESSVNTVRNESQLYAIGLKKYLTEDQMILLAKQASKHIAVTWIKNFTRFIPQELLAKKVKCDTLEIFDNYVVIHYDPKRIHESETKEEEERRKDPILFGLISGSRNLYYIGDWIDEHCSLTLDEAVKIIGTEQGEPKKLKEKTVLAEVYDETKFNPEKKPGKKKIKQP